MDAGTDPATFRPLHGPPLPFAAGLVSTEQGGRHYSSISQIAVRHHFGVWRAPDLV